VELATTKTVFPGFALMREEARAQQAVADAEAFVGSGRAWALELSHLRNKPLRPGTA
jgi:hypothetical protein